MALFSSHQTPNGTWSRPKRHAIEGFVNRVQLAADAEDNLIIAADVYRDTGYDIVTGMMAPDEKTATWTTLTNDTHWNLLPSLAADAAGDVYLTWLHQRNVKRDDVAGCHQTAHLAVWNGKRWKRLTDHGCRDVACLNLGLLPLKRYFGYDGLRRYPRIMPTDNGGIWLCWEQQRDEKEIWSNVSNRQVLRPAIRRQTFRPGPHPL